MAKYRKILPRIWNEARFMGMSDDAQLAYFFVSTHPAMTALGAMRATVAGLAAEKGWTIDRMGEAIGVAIREGYLEGYEEASYIGVVGFLEYNEPESPNVVTKGWKEALELVPDCPPKTGLINRCGSYLEAKGKAWVEAWGKATGKPTGKASRMPKDKGSPYQEQEQEQEQEPEATTGIANPEVPRTPARAREPVAAAVERDPGRGEPGAPDAFAASGITAGAGNGHRNGTAAVTGRFSAEPAGSRRPLPAVVREAEARDRGEYYHGDIPLRPGELWAALAGAFAAARDGSVYAGGLGPRGEFLQEFLPWYREVIPPHLDQGDDLDALHVEVLEVWEFYMKNHRGKGPPRVSGLCKAWNHYRDLYARVKFDGTTEEAAG
jgi:hypothetical protein